MVDMPLYLLEPAAKHIGVPIGCQHYYDDRLRRWKKE